MGVTNVEIARFWKQKQMSEEEHLYAAIKAAARLRARNLSDDDYMQFVESLNDDNASKERSKLCGKKSRGVGIKDWWTKSKYAYLNQPHEVLHLHFSQLE